MLNNKIKYQYNLGNLDINHFLSRELSGGFLIGLLMQLWKDKLLSIIMPNIVSSLLLA